MMTLFLSILPMSGAQITLEMLKNQMQPVAADFERMEIGDAKEPHSFKIQLGDQPIKLGDDYFDGFRFTCPKIEKGSDFVWYFNAPANWGQWYLIQSEGDPRESFKNWLDGDKLYSSYDAAGEKDRLRILQTLDGSYFEPGKEYILWFSRTHGEAAGELRGVLGFAKSSDQEKKSWDYDDIEKALNLKPLPPADQMTELGSRGGSILLDEDLFDPRDAADRIDALFFSKRRTSHYRGGYFMTMSTSVPPCRKTPPLEAIIAKYGEPDFVRSLEEKDRRLDNDDDEEEEPTVTYYYDYFGFEVDPKNQAKVVEAVEAQANDFSKLRSKVTGKTIGVMPMENLTTFYDEGKEVGRVYGLSEGPEVPVVIQEPPVGKYEMKGRTLLNRGSGEWVEEYLFPDGTVKTRCHYEKNLITGKAEGFYPSGKLYYTLSYKDGQLDGPAVKYDENGKEIDRQSWSEGQRQ
ncbi:hypothetical protein JIN85_06770 [Luteolibacter pohnpeiensis]|uniref:MORN repeat variant n=1 Tax=Luteolibacter pohnpeiensis TaxID=454153 RepID=A0A934SB67_9BACT|nr:hypothetical protein [Luteolibacter pohnpeiensis]MBK1882108.1 hypothetical protein [Luteolibacter pohnpeiensis]